MPRSQSSPQNNGGYQYSDFWPFQLSCSTATGFTSTPCLDTHTAHAGPVSSHASTGTAKNPAGDDKSLGRW